MQQTRLIVVAEKHLTGSYPGGWLNFFIHGPKQDNLEGRQRMANRSAASLSTPRRDDPVVAEAVRLLAETCRPERIYLFGSIPRGEATVDSDYDFMVVVPDDAPPELKDDRRAFKALATLGAAMDVLVWTRSEFDRRLHLRASLPSTIVREGIRLYGSGPGENRRHTRTGSPRA